MRLVCTSPTNLQKLCYGCATLPQNVSGMVHVLNALGSQVKVKMRQWMQL